MTKSKSSKMRRNDPQRRRVLAGIVIAISLSSPLLVAGQEPETPEAKPAGESRLAEARDLFARELYPAAQTTYEEYLQNNPDDIEARSELVYSLVLQDKDEQAAEHLVHFPDRPRPIDLDRTDIARKLVFAYARLVSKIVINVVLDEQGRVQGLTTENVEAIPVAVELGLKNGDVLNAINNEAVDTPPKAVKIILKYRNSPIFRIRVLRDGEPHYINYHVR